MCGKAFFHDRFFFPLFLLECRVNCVNWMKCFFSVSDVLQIFFLVFSFLCPIKFHRHFFFLSFRKKIG